MSPAQTDTSGRLESLLKELHLPAIRRHYGPYAQEAARQHLSYDAYLLSLVEQEAQTRRQNTIDRLLRQSRLPLDKTLESFDLGRPGALIWNDLCQPCFFQFCLVLLYVLSGDALGQAASTMDQSDIRGLA